MVLLDTNIFPADIGWRFAFGLGAILGLGIVLVLATFYGVPSGDAPLYLIPFAIANFLGPLFDTVGRRVMISGTYILSGVLLTITGYLLLKVARPLTEVEE